MRRTKTAPARPVLFPPTQINWSEERLATLDTTQLLNLLTNLHALRSNGRVDETSAADLEQRIRARLPARATAVRRKRTRSELMLEARVARELSALAADLAARYALGRPPSAAAESGSGVAAESGAGVRGVPTPSLADSRGHARTGRSAKSGAAAIERYVAWRTRESLAGLAYMLLPGQPETSGRYVLMATDDLLDDEVPANEFTPLAQKHGWSESARARLRAMPMRGLAEAAARYEALLAKVTGAPHAAAVSAEMPASASA